MSTEQLASISDLSNFLNGSQKVAFAVPGNKQEKYARIETVLVKFNYPRLSRHDKGIVWRYIQKISKYSRQQITRLISQYIKTNRITYKHSTVNDFTIKYTKDDALALVLIDELHGNICIKY